MRINTYHMAFAVSASVAAALFLAGKPLGRGEGRSVQAAPAPTASIVHIAGSLAGTGLSDEVKVRRQAIEDVLPLLRSLQARGDTVRLVQAAQSVLRVWAELDSLDPLAMPDKDLRRRVESWAGAPLTARQADPAGELAH